MPVLGVPVPGTQAGQGIAEVLKPEKILAERLLRDGVIMPDEVEIVEYGLENLGSSLLGMLITLAIGFCFDFLLGSFLLWLLIFPLRKNAGGFHAKTKGRCLLFSTAMLLLSILCFVQMECSEIGYILVTIISAGVIFVMAPVENDNKHLDKVECRVYRKRTRVILLLESLLFVLAFVIAWKELIVVVAMDFFIVCVVLITGRVKMLVSRK